MTATRTFSRLPVAGRWWRALAVVSLVLGLIAARPAQAAASNTITLYAPGALATAWTVVQFQTPDGAWHDVDAWQGSLDTFEDSGLQFKQWTVAAENADQGPFRWVIYTAQGGAVWGVSDSFNLPGGDGVDLNATVLSGSATAAETATTETAATSAAADEAVAPAVTPVSVLPVASDSSTWVFDCAGCGYGLLSVYLPDAPAGSWVGVQYQMPDRTWPTVDGWAGDAAEDDNGLQQAHYSVYPENYGQGPFRWVVVQPDGSVWGYSAEFTLPTEGTHFFMFLLRK